MCVCVLFLQTTTNLLWLLRARINILSIPGHSLDLGPCSAEVLTPRRHSPAIPLQSSCCAFGLGPQSRDLLANAGVKWQRTRFTGDSCWCQCGDLQNLTRTFWYVCTQPYSHSFNVIVSRLNHSQLRPAWDPVRVPKTQQWVSNGLISNVHLSACGSQAQSLRP